MNEAHASMLLDIAKEQPDLHLDQISEELENQCGVQYDPNLCYRELKRRGKQIYQERSTQLFCRRNQARVEKNFGHYAQDLSKAIRANKLPSYLPVQRKNQSIYLVHVISNVL